MAQTAWDPRFTKSKLLVWRGHCLWGDPKTFSEVYPDLFDEFSALVNSAGNDDCGSLLVYFTNSVKIQGFQYNIGCVIVTGYDFSGLPQFSVLKNIFVYVETKFFVLEQLNTIYFEHRMLCYVVNPCNTINIVRFTDLSYPWPLLLHNINGQLCVINFCGHVLLAASWAVLRVFVISCVSFYCLYIYLSAGGLQSYEYWVNKCKLIFNCIAVWQVVV